MTKRKRQKPREAQVIGPKGEVRPADTRANASLMARIATGEAEETIRKPKKT